MLKLINSKLRYINVIPKTSDFKLAVPGVFSVMRNVSVPLGISVPDHQNYI